MRIIGRRYDEVRKTAQVVRGSMNNPIIRVIEKGDAKELHPEEVLAELVVKLKDDVAAYTNARIEHAIVTVPTGFNLLQRQAVRDACAIAGLTNYRIKDVSTTAAVGHTSIKGMPRREGHDMVVDLGGGHLSVPLLMIENGIFEVEAVAGITCLGGEDFDDHLYDHFVAEFSRKHRKDMTTCNRAVRRLRTACEKVKRDLSVSNTATLELEMLFGDIDFCSSITRARFEALCSELFSKVTKLIEKVLRDAKINKSQVRDVVLAGGSMRMPKMQQLLSTFFGGANVDKKLCHSILNNNEAAAHGATVMAAAVYGETWPDSRFLVLDAVSDSVGIETDGGVLTSLISRNTTIPAKKSKKFEIFL
ncbi:hypothetical protein SDRG_17122 [Saprolegnia diclina VS20]|uniref:Hsp70-like protein n=1 Tax=Saprolegnia diclina (strain VS20) TaxID=1156394 RepID=T0R683_SAPDV|nr:hypothetical protein SDRG_17122 [Saprolegnia diclina VS20]EQC25002.1 hypothetical protein SDRG_17122 [Saprolegnia diclina VS20]|eukprot:XP_008621579.1 hypothetical protein SDRG_17122 [Saprolegnia diclina VS20]